MAEPTTVEKYLDLKGLTYYSEKVKSAINEGDLANVVTVTANNEGGSFTVKQGGKTVKTIDFYSGKVQSAIEAAGVAGAIEVDDTTKAGVVYIKQGGEVVGTITVDDLLTSATGEEIENLFIGGE